MNLESVVYPGMVASLFSVGALLLAGIYLLALQYHRFGRLTWGHSLAGIATMVYVFAVGAYTMLPLPESREASCQVRTGGLQLDPLQPLRDLRSLAEQGGSVMLHSSIFWQLALNVLLFIPLGILAVRWLGLNPLVAVVLGFMGSVFIEVLQYTGIGGLYCSYRVADVGDIATNTLGALIGVLLAYTPLFAWIRTPKQLSSAAKQHPLTRVRRLWGMLFDLAFVALAVVLGQTAQTVVDEAIRLGLPSFFSGLGDLMVWVFPLCVTVVPLFGARRSTLGQRAVWLDRSSISGGQAPLGFTLIAGLLGTGGYTIWTVLERSSLDSPSWVSGLSGLWVLANGVFILLDSSARGLSSRPTGLTFTPRSRRDSPAPTTR
ncbi:MAG: VanZ family protein [Galactobacter sp.]|uniref:VanZ family protein n=1 Tax=Galactobacter sp. TaxID=2676125 RepID=UPI0025BFC75D|nr:VanZ family protein [Galactobacter sp.]